MTAGKHDCQGRRQSITFRDKRSTDATLISVSERPPSFQSVMPWYDISKVDSITGFGETMTDSGLANYSVVVISHNSQVWLARCFEAVLAGACTQERIR